MFSSELLQLKINIGNHLKIVKLGGNVKLGAFDIDYVTLTHSILEPNGLAITTPEGVVLHTADWKIDDDPLIGVFFGKLIR